MTLNNIITHDGTVITPVVVYYQSGNPQGYGIDGFAIQLGNSALR